MTKTIRYAGVFFLSFLGLIVSAFVGLALFDIYAQFAFGDPRDEANYSRKIQFSTTYFDESSGTSHIIGPQHHTGPAPFEWIDYEDGFDIRSNKFGFFTDWPVDAYPEKESNEFRIILIGGSGAQGHGGQTNNDMFYKVLERMLDERLAPRGIDVHVINLAMAGDHLVTNREILHAYAEPLDGDMILAYVGVNDISQIMLQGWFLVDRDIGYGHPDFGYPWFADWLVELFPTTFLKLGAGKWLRAALGIEGQRNPLGRHHRHHLGDLHKTAPDTFYRDHLVPRLTSALKAIKRESCGAPIVVVRQIWGQPEWANGFLERDYKLTPVAGRRPYDYWWDSLSSDLPGYLNTGWYFLDAHQGVWSQVDYEIQYGPGEIDQYTVEWTDGQTYDVNEKSLHVHLDNTGHYFLSDWLAPQLEDIVARHYTASREDLCEVEFR